jgi:[calcium/calmodulin-dependent protein kinase] kinase
MTAPKEELSAGGASKVSPFEHEEIPTIQKQHTPPQSVELEEQFDQDGNAIKVGNLEFVEGTLGTGAYGTVRLARTLSPSSSGSSTPASSMHRSERRKIRKQARRNNFARSMSAPTGSLFLRSPEDQHRLERSTSSIVDLFLSPRKKETVDDNLVAVKIYNKSILKRMRTMERDKATNKVRVKTAFDTVEREIALMKKLSHPNLVALYDVIDSPESDNLYMIIEYMPLGEILTYQDDGTFARKPPKLGHQQIAGVVNGHFDEAFAALFFVDILHALGYLHQHHICHRDLKPENILLDSRGVAKLGDFGVSHFFEDEKDFGPMRRLTDAPQHHPTQLTRMDTDSALQMTGLAGVGLLQKTEGTWCFWAPEMCSNSSSYFSGYASDMWAAGVCLYIFVTGKLPFFSEVPTELFEMIAEAKVPYKGLGLSNSLIDLLEKVLEKDPAKRAGVGDCLKHSFLQVARNTRIRQLSEEFAQSRNLSTAVEEDDIKKAFRVVTSFVNPATLLKNASKHLHDGFQCARERLSKGMSTSSSSSLVGSDDEKMSGWSKMQPPNRWNTPTMNRGSWSSSIGSDDDDQPTRQGNTPPQASKRWNQLTKRAAYQHVGASLSSFESTGSESSVGGMGPSSHSKLFPIPQGRVMTESSRNMGLGSQADLNTSLTERSGGTQDEDESHDTSTPVKSPMSAPEKRAPEVSAEETLEKPIGSPKRLRSKRVRSNVQFNKKSEERCTIQ